MGTRAVRVIGDEGRVWVYSTLDELAVELAQNPDEKEPQRWIHYASTGDWWNMARGQVLITGDDLRTMYQNFKSGTYPQAPTEAPIDYEHLSTSPNRKPGDGIAAGWIKDVELRENGNELWVLVQWLEDAADKIRKRHYRGFSPTFHPNWIVHGGRAIGPTIIGGALTNYPTMPLRTLTLDQTGFDSSLSARTQTGESTRKANMKLITVKNDKGEDVQISLDSLGGLDLATLSAIPTVKELADKAAKVPGEDKIVVDKTEFTSLKTDVTTLSNTVNSLKADNDKLKADADAATKRATEAEIDGLIKEGRILPAEKEDFVGLAQEAPTRYASLIGKRKAAEPLVKLSQEHGSGGGGSSRGVNGEGAASKEFANLVSQHIADEKAKGRTVSYAEAAKHIGRTHVELAQAVRQEETVEIPGVVQGAGGRSAH